MSENLPDKGQFLVYEAEDGQIKIDVRLEDETVWLTQPLMAKLFQTTQQNISQHVHNIYEESELEPEPTHKKFLSVRQEGTRQVQRNLDFYNLDMIIGCLFTAMVQRKPVGELEVTRLSAQSTAKNSQKSKAASEKRRKRY